jgi:hypothetical protein
MFFDQASWDEALTKTKILHETRLREAEHHRLVNEARQHTQQVLAQTAQSLRANYPQINAFDVTRMMFGMLFGTQGKKYHA